MAPATIRTHQVLCLPASDSNMLWTPDEIETYVDEQGLREQWEAAHKLTRSWCRNASDVHAVTDGNCKFDLYRGSWAVWWIERYCRLYEGEWAGEPLRLRGLHSLECDWDIPGEARGHLGRPLLGWKRDMYSRAFAHNEAIRGGEPADWQYECTMRMFGWKAWSARWGRYIRRFKRASIWQAKKNKKSPTQAAWAVYMMCGDGEQGQKVFIFARDGQQARHNVGEHVKNMYRQSPELLRQCKFNKQLYRLSHIESSSWLEPMSATNARTAKSKEGINGSVFIDETHVVDRESVGRVDRAGISRAEPVHAEFSTAGDDPDGYGKEQFDRALKIIKGEIIDQEVMAAVYAIPQQATEKEILADPVRYARMANPAFGHTVEVDELLRDLERSKESPMKLAKCLMYRFNKWMYSAAPWIRLDTWDACRDTASIKDFEGDPCVLALDLSREDDMTCLMRVFARRGDQHSYRWDEKEECWFCAFCGDSVGGEHACEDEPPDAEGCEEAYEFYLFPLIYQKDDYARQQSELLPPDFFKWAEAGAVQLLPAQSNMQSYVKRDIQLCIDRFQVEAIYSDPWDCRPIAEWVIDEQLGPEVVYFKQAAWVMKGAIDDFEVMMRRRIIHHDGNPVMRWQMGHATVLPRATGKLIVKPSSRHDVKKVDAVVSGIMAVAGAIEQKLGSGGAWSGEGTGMWG